jgi:hypothetical protein
MERTPTELALEDLLPRLEAEHDAEPDEDVRDAIWTLITAAEDYLLERRTRRTRGGDVQENGD